MGERDLWLGRVAAIRRWSRDGYRAPHKPLLLLYAFGRLQQTGTSRMRYAASEADLQGLLDEYGPAGRSTTPAYPFHYLQSDNLWIVEAQGKDPGTRVGALRAHASGRLEPSFENALRSDPELLALVAHNLLDANFPESLHSGICAAAGLTLDIAAPVRAATELLRRRDPEFRYNVLVAYEFRCAMCGYDGRLGAQTVGLDAAHIQWWAFDGPDTLDNALCLCSLHHKLLDTGAVGVSEQHTVLVSRHFVGRSKAAEDLVISLSGQPLLEVQDGLPQPAISHITWHADQVFRRAHRPPASIARQRS